MVSVYARVCTCPAIHSGVLNGHTAGERSRPRPQKLARALETQRCTVTHSFCMGELRAKGQSVAHLGDAAVYSVASGGAKIEIVRSRAFETAIAGVEIAHFGRVDPKLIV